MTKTHLGVLLLATAAFMEFSSRKALAGNTDATTKLGSVENTLTEVNLTTGTTVHVSYIIGAIGVYFLVS